MSDYFNTVYSGLSQAMINFQLSNFALAAIKFSLQIIFFLIFGFLGGAGVERIALKNSISNILSAKNWNVTVKLLISICMVRFLFAFSCASNYQTFNIFSDNSCFIETSSRFDWYALVSFFVNFISITLGARYGSAIQPVGLTGGIACGKSTVARLLQEGDKDIFNVIDVDAIAHDVLHPYKMGTDSAYKKLVNTFGTDILMSNENKISNSSTTNDKNEKNTPPHIDRRKLGAIIFHDPSKRKILNGITHPLIIKIMLKSIMRENLLLRSWRSHSTNAKPNVSLLCVDIPLLFEGGALMRALFALKVTVSCNQSLQLKRLRERNPDLTLKQCEERIASQYPIEKKISMSDLVIDNNGDMDALVCNVNQIRREISMRVRGWNFYVDQMIFVEGFLIAIIQILHYFLLK